jgi:hypothetical protein
MTDGEPLSRFIAKIDEVADKANEATRTVFPDICSNERIYTIDDIPWNKGADVNDCKTIFAKMIALAPCFINTKLCAPEILAKYNEQSSKGKMSLITDDDKLCKLLSSIAASHQMVELRKADGMSPCSMIHPKLQS